MCVCVHVCVCMCVCVCVCVCVVAPVHVFQKAVAVLITAVFLAPMVQGPPVDVNGVYDPLVLRSKILFSFLFFLLFRLFPFLIIHLFTDLFYLLIYS